MQARFAIAALGFGALALAMTAALSVDARAESKATDRDGHRALGFDEHRHLSTKFVMCLDH